MSGPLSLGHLRREPRKHPGVWGREVREANPKCIVGHGLRGQQGFIRLWKFKGARAKHKPQRCGARGLECLSTNSSLSRVEGCFQGHSIPALLVASGLGLGQSCECGAGKWIWLVSTGWCLLVGDGQATSNFCYSGQFQCLFKGIDWFTN